MSVKMPSWLEPAVWGLMAGIVGCWLLLSYGFGWMSPVEAGKLSDQKIQDALVAYATPACVSRFERQSNAVAAWETLKKTDDWSRGDLVVKDGWVTGHGQKLNSDTAKAVATSCATQILALKTLAGVQLGLK